MVFVIAVGTIITIIIFLVVVLLLYRRSNKKNTIGYVDSVLDNDARSVKFHRLSLPSDKLQNDSSQININRSSELSNIEVQSRGSKIYSGSIGLDSKKDFWESNNNHFLKNRFLGFYIILGAGIMALLEKSFIFQIFNWSKYEKKSDDNMFTTLSTPAPRGKIFDCNGIELANSKNDICVMAKSDVLKNRDVMLRLSAVLGLPLNIVKQRLMNTATGIQNDRIISSDTSIKNASFISEHSDAFPGVHIEFRSKRQYPYGALAAHAIGYVSVANEEELKNSNEGSNIQYGDLVGKSGIESYYNSILSGDHGERTVVTDANGNIHQVYSEKKPVQGSNVYLTINAYIQYRLDILLAKASAPNGITGSGTCSGLSAVIMDPRNGNILAMSSFPRFDPNSLNGTVSEELWEIYNNEYSYYPMLNRSISGLYPAASTYKAFTGLASLEMGIIQPTTSYYCSGSWDAFNSGLFMNCWKHSGHGSLNLYSALVNSCDIYFYECAATFFYKTQSGEWSINSLADIIAKFGFKELTGIDLEGEQKGRVPTDSWKRKYFSDYPDETYWKGGDFANMMIGQGYVLTSPLQLCVAYGGIATGKLVRPHLLNEVKNTSGITVSKFQPEIVNEIDVKPANLEVIRDGLHQVVQGGECLSKFKAVGFFDCAGKTGTAEIAGHSDCGIFAGYAPYKDPHFVISLFMEDSEGSTVATPIAAEMLKFCVELERGTVKGKLGRIDGSNSVS